MADKTLTAPLAVIKLSDGTSIGKIKNLRITESYQRGDVKGLGVLVATEKPILSITCSFTASSYFIDLTKWGSANNPFVQRTVGMALKDFLNTILLQDSGVDIYLYRTISKTVTNGIVVETDVEKIGVIGNAFLDSQNFDITESQISGSDLSGTYLESILL